jgi:Ni,Fe-hydrogenase I cytochrome b subunit
MMSETIPRLILYVLVGVHVFLGLWAIVGWTEWFVQNVPWQRVSNPAFDRGMLFVHWLVILSASVIFLTGYFTRSPHLPAAMTFIYASMALVCALQTFFYLENSSKYVAMILEYAAYAIILFLLWRVEFFRDYFSKSA